jgi:hypothetical protein
LFLERAELDDQDQDNICKDRDEVQIDNLKGRKRYWAFGGVQFKNQHKLGMKGKGCFMVQPNHEMQYEVVRIEKHDLHE